MARTDLTVESVVPAGVMATYTDAIADGHMFMNNGRRIVHVKNNSASSVTITIQTDLTRDSDLDLPDRDVDVSDAGETFIGPFDMNIYSQTSGDDEGKVYIDYSDPTDVTVAVLEVD